MAVVEKVAPMHGHGRGLCLHLDEGTASETVDHGGDRVVVFLHGVTLLRWLRNGYGDGEFVKEVWVCVCVC